MSSPHVGRQQVSQTRRIKRVGKHSSSRRSLIIHRHLLRLGDCRHLRHVVNTEHIFVYGSFMLLLGSVGWSLLGSQHKKSLDDRTEHQTVKSINNTPACSFDHWSLITHLLLPDDDFGSPQKDSIHTKTQPTATNAKYTYHSTSPKTPVKTWSFYLFKYWICMTIISSKMRSNWLVGY